MRNIVALMKSDLRRLFSNVISVIITVGLIVMPSIFAWYNILACWNVFDNTGNLTIAVANTDEGYESDLMPIRVNIGDRVVSALRANDQIAWRITDEEDAVDGARAGRYYAAIVIPQDFSREMLNFYKDDSEHAQIIYYANEKKSAIAPKITDQGADTVAYQINEMFVETLSEVGLSIAESLANYAESSDATGRIADLSEHIANVADDMDRAREVLALYAELARSTEGLLEDGAALTSTAQREADTLLSTASEGIGSATSLVDALQGSLDQLSEMLQRSIDGMDSLKEPLQNLFGAVDAGTTHAISTLRSQSSTLEAQSASYKQLANQLQALVPNVAPEYRPALEGVVIRMNAAADTMAAMAENLTRAADKLEQGSTDTKAELDACIALVEDAKAQLAQAKTEYDQSVAPALEDLAAKVAVLAKDMSAAVKDLDSASNTLSLSANSAAAALSGAADDINAAVSEMEGAGDSLRTLSAGIQEALASGDTEKLEQLLSVNTKALASAVAAPVGLDRIAIFPVEDFGSAMAPLYTTLAIFIGSLLIMVVVKPRVSRHAQQALHDPTPSQLFLGRFGVCAFLSLAQTTLTGIGNMWFLQIQVVDPVLFMLCYWVSGLVFTFIIYALVATFANLGKAIAVLMLIIQVTGCGGSVPLQILPGFVQAISPWLPATHVVNAMRAAMMGVYQADYWIEMGELLLFLIPAAIIGLVLQKYFAKFMAWYLSKVEASKIIC